MKHIFVVNPQAGGEDKKSYIVDTVKNIDAEAEVYVTREPLDATRFVADRCANASGEALRFYACGGDGTLNEVVAGVVQSGAADVEVGCYPCGSGNDYVKSWPGVDFLDFQRLMDAPSTPVDVMRVATPQGERCCVNVLNFGFEAEVCRTMNVVRRWPLVGRRGAYTTGIVHCLLHAMHNPCNITVDGEAWQGGDLLLASAANGRFVGGGYQCAPRAVVDDGWLEVTCVDTISILRFVKLIGHYRQGTHLEREDMRDVVHYRRGRRVVFDSERQFSVVVDGELLGGKHFEVECLPKAVRFIVPTTNV